MRRMTAADSKATLTTAEAAKAVGISRATLQAWLAAGKVEAPALRLRPGEPPARTWSRADVDRLRAVKEKIYRRGGGRGRKKKTAKSQPRRRQLRRPGA